MTTPTGRPASLLNRNFVLLWQGQLVSRLGGQVFMVSMMFWTLEQTRSATLMGLVLTAGRVMTVLLGPIAGAFADRHPRLRIIVACDLVRGVITCALAAAFWLFPPDALFPLLFAAVLLNGVFGAFFNPAITSATPDLVPESKLAAANSLQQASMQTSALVGQSIGGVLYQAVGAPLLFLADGLTFLFSGASEALIRLRDAPASAARERSTPDGYLTAAAEGMRYVWAQTGMRAFFVMASILNFLAMPIVVLLPLYVTDVLGAGADWYGFLLAALSAGSILGYALAAVITVQGTAGAWTIVGMLASFGVGLAALGVTESRWLALGLLFATGVLTGAITTLELTVLQRTTPSQLRGRVMGLLYSTSEALMPLGMLAGGVAGDLTGHDIPLIYRSCGGLAVLTVLTLGSRRTNRAFLASF